MATSDFLVSHALENVWCQPIQDKQHLIEPARYTPESGAYKRAKVHRYVTDLPSSYDGVTTWHHLYHIGRVYPVLLALDDLNDTWVRADIIAEKFGVQLNVFLGSGESIALCHCYLRKAYDDNILLAVEIRSDFYLGSQANLDDPSYGAFVPRTIGSSTLYFRCYQSARARTIDWRQISHSDYKPVTYVYKFINSQTDFNAFISAVNAAKTKHANMGKGCYFNDGLMVGTISGYNSAKHRLHLLSYVHDEMVVYDECVPVAKMGAFVSSLDYNMNKMLVMVEAAVSDLSINYHDDVDFYLYNRASTTDPYGVGVYIGRTHPATVRQVTQNAYSLRTDTLIALLNEQRNTLGVSLGNYYIRCVVRDGAMRKPLPFQKNRINDLYLLSVDQIKQAMYGANSIVNEWRAEVLEASSFSKIMSGSWSDVTEDLVVDAYGFHALSKLSFNELITPQNGYYNLNEGYKHTPVANGVNASYLRYDASGKLLGWNNILIDNDLYNDGRPSSYAEFFNLLVSEESDGVVYDQNVSSSDLANYGFRAYVCTMIGGIPTEDWQDVTGTAYYSYALVAGVPKVTWNYSLLNAASLYPAIKVGNKIHITKYKPNNPDYFGTLKFSVITDQNWFGVTSKRPQHIPSNTLLLFLGDTPLVENVDYYVNWPEITIVKRPFTSTSEIANCEVTIMHYGLVTGVGKHTTTRESGFTYAGRLSSNGVYDLRNDRNIKIIVDGRVYIRNEVKFAESSGSTNFVDGRPYSIMDYRLPLGLVIDRDVSPMMVEADLTDAKVSGYLSDRLPQVDVGQAFISGNRYELVSPLVSAILHGIVNNNLFPDSQLDRDLNNVVIEQLIASYLPLLAYEPINNGASVYMVNIRPHPYAATMEVTALQYALLEYIIHVLLRDSVDLTPYVTIRIGGN